MVSTTAIVAWLSALSLTAAASCRVFPGDPDWPSDDDWDALNAQVGGRLHAARPPAASCHATYEGAATYNLLECTAVSLAWGSQEFHSSDPVSVHYDVWTNGTCLPASPTCTPGLYPRYYVNASSTEDVQAAVNFARERNIRLIIKNTGHDFLGKSIGAGSLSIWTHNLKDIEIIDSYNDPSTSYTGGAVRLGAGWQVGDLYRELDAVGKAAVGGECRTVGLAGGYIQGGGHGPLSTLHGLASDNALQYKVVLADGTSVTADAANNPDLFWALRGGGGGTFGVVTEVIIKTHDSPPMAAMQVHITASGDPFWVAWEAFHNASLNWTAEGMYAYYASLGIEGANYFQIKPLIAPGKTQAELEALTAPYLATVRAAGINPLVTFSEHPSLYQAYTTHFDGEPAGSAFNMYVSGRLIHGSHLSDNAAAVTSAHRSAVDTHNLLIIGHMTAPGLNGGVSNDTSVNPGWKETVLFPMYCDFWGAQDSDTTKRQKISDMEALDGQFKAATPGAGGYSNEGNMYDPEWQTTFWGDNYARLLDIKREVDPDELFYVVTGVGSEGWYTDNEGRLCPKEES